MANDATLVSTTKVGAKTVYSYNFVIDTPDEDLIIRDPIAAHKGYVVGIFTSETDALNLSLKFGDTVHSLAELAANQGLALPVTKPLSWIACGAPGEAITLRSSAAGPSSGVIHVFEAKRA